MSSHRLIGKIICESHERDRAILALSEIREDGLFWGVQSLKGDEAQGDALITQDQLETGTLEHDLKFDMNRVRTFESKNIQKTLGTIHRKSLDPFLRKLVKQPANLYYEIFHKKEDAFTPGDRIGYAGRVFDFEEMGNLLDSSLDFWLTSGKYTAAFELALAKKIGTRYAFFVNSGSSANLLAFSALTSPYLRDRQIKRGDEVITVSAGFPTTVAPIIQYGAIPVFVDVSVDDGTYNIDVESLKEALSAKTKALFVAHTLGNPFNLSAVKEFCEKNNLWLVEDNCDALGSQYQEKYTGTFGHMSTSSFYPAHHITTGEGGAVYTSSGRLKRILESIRDWGRDCWCVSGKDNTCNKRFEQTLGSLPYGFDHKYTYSHFGYNLKATDMQASIGLAQLKKLDAIAEARRNNWNYFRASLDHLSEYFILPEKTPLSNPSWFGFIITLRDNLKFSRGEITRYLEDRNIQTRPLFAGNLLRHPCFDQLRESGEGYRVIGDLKNTDRIMMNTFWIGVYSGITPKMSEYIVEVIKEFLKLKC